MSQSLGDRQRLHAVIDAIAQAPLDPSFPRERLLLWHELVDAGEPLVALELLASNVDEFAIPLPESARFVLREIGDTEGLGQAYLDLLVDPN
ncbi:MAG: hypothetical protein ACHQAW_05195 [Actinomycetota bacterium]|jgi:hypothetical protein